MNIEYDTGDGAHLSWQRLIENSDSLDRVADQGTVVKVYQFLSGSGGLSVVGSNVRPSVIFSKGFASVHCPYSSRYNHTIVFYLRCPVLIVLSLS